MAANFRITIEKYLATQAEYWTNVYWSSATAIADAAATAAALVAIERGMYLPSVTITKYRVDDGEPNTDIFVTTPVNLVGTSGLTGQALPLFNVVRIDFAAGQGRPSRKYYRGVLTEEWSDAFGALPATAKTQIQEWADNLAAVSSYVDVDGDDIVAGSAYPSVGMRQLRRGSKKKNTP